MPSEFYFRPPCILLPALNREGQGEGLYFRLSQNGKAEKMRGWKKKDGKVVGVICFALQNDTKQTAGPLLLIGCLGGN